MTRSELGFGKTDPISVGGARPAPDLESGQRRGLQVAEVGTEAT